jgi:hypothetical protein
LIMDELCRLGERNYDDADTAPVEFYFMVCHLAEMSLARQSGEVSKEDQQQTGMLKLIGQLYRLAA